MADGIEQVKEILKEAEDRLREVIAASAMSGDYRTADVGRVAAVRVHELVRQVGEGSLCKRDGEAGEGAGGKRGGSDVERGSSKGKLSGYPKYGVRGDCVVKIGWSKKRLREYRHSVPATVLSEVVKIIVGLQRESSDLVTAGQIMEKLKVESGKRASSYHVYVVMGLLRNKGCIRQMGHAGYAVGLDFFERVESVMMGMKNI